MTETFTILPDPRVNTPVADYAKQLELLLKIRDKLTETHNAIISLREVRRQADDVAKRVQGQGSFKVVTDAAKSLNEKLTSVEETLYQTKNQSSQDPLNYPIRLNNKLAALAGVVASADATPTDQANVVYHDLVGQIDAQLREFERIMKTDLPAFNQLVREQNIPAVIVKPSGGNN